jgi:hypothetical protein
MILHPHEWFISIGGGGDWDQDPCSRRRHNFGVGGILLTHLFFLIRVVEDDDVAITRWPEDVAVEVAKESPGGLLITRSIRDETFLIWRWRKIHDRSLSGGTPYSNTNEHGRCEETSGRDPSSGSNP